MLLPTYEDQYRATLARTTPAVVAQLTCPDCGAPMVLKLSQWGRFYGCTMWKTMECRGSVSARDSGKPLGDPAPTGSNEKKRRRKLMQKRFPVSRSRWERLQDEMEQMPPSR